MIQVTATLNCSFANAEALLSALKTLQQHSREEAGCEQYDLGRRSHEDSIEYVVIERWRSQEDLEQHFVAGHFEQFKKQTQALIICSEMRMYMPC